MAPKDLKALLLLMDHPRGMYGSEMVDVSGQYLSRGTIYNVLGRLVARGLVREVRELPSVSAPLPRTRHYITGQGQRAVRDYLDNMALDRRVMSLSGGV